MLQDERMEKGGRERGSNSKKEWCEDWTSGPRDLNGLGGKPHHLGSAARCKLLWVLLLWE